MPVNGMVTLAAFLMASSMVVLVSLVLGGPQQPPRRQVEKPLGSGRSERTGSEGIRQARTDDSAQDRHSLHPE